MQAPPLPPSPKHSDEDTGWGYNCSHPQLLFLGPGHRGTNSCANYTQETLPKAITSLTLRDEAVDIGLLDASLSCRFPFSKGSPQWARGSCKWLCLACVPCSSDHDLSTGLGCPPGVLSARGCHSSSRLTLVEFPSLLLGINWEFWIVVLVS